MRKHSESRDVLLLDPPCELPMGAKATATTEKQDEPVSNSYLQISDSQFDTESSDYDNHEDNDDIYLEHHLNSSQQRSLYRAEINQYQRSKQKNKKMKAQRQIKTKHARSIQLNSHNKHLYVHHRLAKQMSLTPAKKHYIRSPTPVPLYTLEALRELVRRYRHMYGSTSLNYMLRERYPLKADYELYIDDNPYDYFLHHQQQQQQQQYHDYTINQLNMPDEASYDDEMIHFLLDMQNRDLSPEDYEMLLRLDDRVQRKTVNSNIIESLPVIDVDLLQLHDQCSICMENYQLGQRLRRLPCEHLFHSDCIERYLRDFSHQCPLDNLPLI